jgi:DedD protein
MNMAQLEDEASLNGQIELKKRARRRLIGAAALALLAVVVLPVVMDREPQPVTQEVQIRIPNQNGDDIVFHIRSGEATPLPPADSDDLAKRDAPVVEPPLADEAPRDDTNALADKPATAPGKPAAIPGRNAAPQKPVKPADKPAVTGKDEEAQARVALSGKESNDKWLVLIGTYKEETNVKQAIGKLKQIGVPFFTERFESAEGTRTRVRAGPFNSRQAAEQALAKMSKADIHGQITQSGK